jgi:hypothetical protein
MSALFPYGRADFRIEAATNCPPAALIPPEACTPIPLRVPSRAAARHPLP